ncbi:MAG: glutaminyl-peptide cyclotransferase [Candidatus Dadabacteria bacterium]|nr:glutaminyl-peptide cyclotransferase [Candidatus Dadabacteria bacterium]NIQ13268.1 glutaminyl-peptide cyclotransferase [Candidatus Dadabacteria bacterium]
MNLKTRKFNSVYLIIGVIAVFIFAFSGYSSYKTAKVGNSYKIINIFPHDKTAFTQGLEFNDGYLYESTGLYGRSSIRKVDIKTAKILKLKTLSSNYFGEGITILNNRIFQLTWQSRTGFIYNKDTFDMIGSFNYRTQGWGLTNNKKELIYSDGSSKLYFMDPENFKILKILNVSDKEGKAVRNLNELEYINGKVYANIWRSDKIVAINPVTGIVEKWIDLADLRSKLPSHHKVDVLNGIAYNPENNTFYITGKYWSNLFQIEIN